MRHVSEDEMVFHIYGDERGSAGARVEQHLQECETCRQRHRALRQFLSAVPDAEVPERDEDYGSVVWNRIRAHLPERPPRRSWWTMPAVRRWAAVGAVATLVVAAFLAGRMWRPAGQTPDVAQRSPEIREKVLLVAVGSHLEQSQMVLLELMHAPADGKVDISSEQEQAVELVAANRLYRQTASGTGDAALAQVLDELERVLLEIAHQPGEVSPAQLKELQDRIASQGILFKVRVVKSKVGTGTRSVPEAGSESDGTRSRV